MSDAQHRARDERAERRWGVAAAAVVAGALAFSAFFGFIVLPLAQAPGAGIDPWTAICRAVGLKPGTPARPQPPVSAVAQPVSQVVWSPHTLAILASADQRPGAELASGLCASCHGEDGLIYSDQFPKLAGQSPAAIYKQLSDFRSGARVNDQMTAIAQSLTTDQLAQVAAYFGHQRAGAILGRGYFDPDSNHVPRLVGRGDPARRIPPCEACHAAGAGGPIEAPVIAGQNAAYLERQLLAFRTGQRRNDVYQRMRDIAARLRPEEIHSVAQTYEGFN
jgi:cytochrome c553